MNEQERNNCYTYFMIRGDFDPDKISIALDLVPSKHWKIGDLRKNGTKYDFALWEYGRCDSYNVCVEKQMIKTLEDLLPQINILNEIKQKYNTDFTLEIVPSIYVGGINPCLAPSREVIKFCYETGTNIDIDLYLFDSTD